ncbi:MAG TPA: pyrroloquinoline quinone biosynthesis protein PqqB [Candidatus Dormibacteraeota bacterium]|nr:pyrroloquinoline quinone biosynthesis protein PqqB [Candidatus Dormibacteraeota bacterium]
MRIKILGSAAGGGFPQWNCSCRNCRLLREGSPHFHPRTQTQIAFSPDSDSSVWFLVGASPDLRSQIIAAPELAPHPNEPGHSPIGGVFLYSADVDSVMGLLHLREFQSFFVFATPGVQRILKKENRIFGVLERSDPPVQWQTLSSRGRLGCHLSESPGESPAFICNTLPLGGAYPDYASEDLLRSCSPDDASVAFLLEQTGKQLFIAPSLSPHSTEWTKPASSADLVLIDGTFWSDDELIHTGRTKKTAREIGHLPLSGPGGLLEQFPANARGRKILLHINNTNPILDEQSAEHRAVLEAGFEIAYDGMEIAL